MHLTPSFQGSGYRISGLGWGSRALGLRDSLLLSLVRFHFTLRQVLWLCVSVFVLCLGFRVQAFGGWLVFLGTISL